MHIAIATEGTRGDVAPMLFLAASLREAGHRISFAAPPGFRAPIEAAGHRFAGASADVHAFMDAHAAEIARGGLRAMRTFDSFSRSNVGAQFDAAFAAAEGADLMLAAGVQLGAASAAEAFGIPYRYVCYCPALFPSSEHPPFVVPWMGLPGWANRWLWRGFLPLFSALGRGALNPERRARGLGPARRLHDHLVSPRPILATDAGLAAAPTDFAPREPIIGIPALQPLEGEPLSEKLESFLAAGSEPVYLGFGSMTDPDPAATTRLLLDAVDAAGCRAVLSSGWARLGDVALPASVFVAAEESHASLFARCAAVVHHGGAGTTTTAARAGRPQILVPHVLDQFYWAARAQSRGVAPPPLPRAKLDARTLAETLRAVLDNELAAENARALGARLRGEYGQRFRPEAVLDGLEA